MKLGAFKLYGSGYMGKLDASCTVPPPPHAVLQARVAHPDPVLRRLAPVAVFILLRGGSEQRSLGGVVFMEL
jgi:hypothetical protein